MILIILKRLVLILIYSGKKVTIKKSPLGGDFLALYCLIGITIYKYSLPLRGFIAIGLTGSLISITT